jgi:hypothetical protein
MLILAVVEAVGTSGHEILCKVVAKPEKLATE